MKKSLKLLIIFLISFVILPKIAFASCTDAEEAYFNYNDAQTELDKIDCSKARDNATASACNTNNMKKVNALQQLYNYKEKEPTCMTAAMNQVLDDNSDICSKVDDTELKDLASSVLKLFYILAPFLLLLFGSVDLIQMIVAGDPNTIKKSRSNLIKRFAAFILIFLLPSFVSILLGGTNLGDSKEIGYTCKSTLTMPKLYYDKVYTVQNVRYKSSYGYHTANTAGVARLLETAENFHKEMEDNNWFYYSKYDGNRFPDIYDLEDHLYWNNIKASTYDTRATCCATFIGSVLYLSDLFTEEEVNAYNYNCCSGIHNILLSHGWYRIDDYDDLQAGDVVFMYGENEHVQLYAGNGTWYNAGGTWSIRTDSPYESNVRSDFHHAYRMP